MTKESTHLRALEVNKIIDILRKVDKSYAFFYVRPYILAELLVDGGVRTSKGFTMDASSEYGDSFMHPDIVNPTVLSISPTNYGSNDDYER